MIIDKINCCRTKKQNVCRDYIIEGRDVFFYFYRPEHNSSFILYATLPSSTLASVERVIHLYERESTVQRNPSLSV